MKNLLVIITATAASRQREGLRAAVGIGLRGDSVHLLLVSTTLPDNDPDLERGLATLELLGQTVTHAPDRQQLQRAIGLADAVEVWT